MKSVLDRNNIYSYVFGININGYSSSAQNQFVHEDAYDYFADEVFIPATAEDIATSISPGLVNKIVTDTGFGGEQELDYEPVILQVGANQGGDFHCSFIRCKNNKPSN